MLRGNAIGMVLGNALMLAGSVFQAQAPGQSAPVQRANEPNTAAARSKVEFRVVFWYEAKHPPRTLKWKIYDLRQGGYDRLAVDDWLAKVNSGFPAYVVLDRTIELEALPAATESDRLAVAFTREQQQVLAKAEASAEPKPEPILRGGMPQLGATGRGTSSSSFAGSYSLSDLMHPGGVSTTTSGLPGHGSRSSFPGVPPGSGGYSWPPSSPFPFPYPSSRPHP